MSNGTIGSQQCQQTLPKLPEPLGTSPGSCRLSCSQMTAANWTPAGLKVRSSSTVARNGNGGTTSKTNLYIAGLTEAMTDSSVRRLVEGVIEPKSCKALLSANGKCTGTGFIDCLTEADAEIAKSFLETKYGSANPNIVVTTGNGYHNEGNTNNGMTSLLCHDVVREGRRLEVKFAFENEKDPLNIYVRNLPRKGGFDTRQLRALFSEFGEVTSVKLLETQTGGETLTGAGFVRFSSSEEATAAMEAVNSRNLVLPGCDAAVRCKLADKRQRAAVPDGSTSSDLPQDYNMPVLMPTPIPTNLNLSIPISLAQPTSSFPCPHQLPLQYFPVPRQIHKPFPNGTTTTFLSPNPFLSPQMIAPPDTACHMRTVLPPAMPSFEDKSHLTRPAYISNGLTMGAPLVNQLVLAPAPAPPLPLFPSPPVTSPSFVGICVDASGYVSLMPIQPPPLPPPPHFLPPPGPLLCPHHLEKSRLMPPPGPMYYIASAQVPAKSSNCPLRPPVSIGHHFDGNMAIYSHPHANSPLILLPPKLAS